VRAYHRVDPLMDERKSDYTPAQFGAYLKVQLVAGRQKDRGRFRSVKALAGALPGSYARHIPFLIEQRDIVEANDGTVYVDGWDEWQEGDITVKERMARLRNRQRNNHRNNGVTRPSPTANATESLSLRGSSGSSVSVGAPPSLSDEEQREQLDRLRDTLAAKGILPATKRDNGVKPPKAETDEQLIARCQAIVADSEAPDWKRDVAREQLELMGVR
jgi:hypothetical protein